MVVKNGDFICPGFLVPDPSLFETRFGIAQAGFHFMGSTGLRGIHDPPVATNHWDYRCVLLHPPKVGRLPVDAFKMKEKGCGGEDAQRKAKHGDRML